MPMTTNIPTMTTKFNTTSGIASSNKSNSTTSNPFFPKKSFASSSSSNNNKKSNNNMKLKPMIKIKPFQKPPTLPPNFYSNSLQTLQHALSCILAKISLSTTSPTTYNNSPKLEVSREELFGMVQDLCTHNYGPQLYMELISILNQGALSCVTRLVDHKTNGNNNIPTIQYPTPHCCLENSNDHGDTNSNSTQVYFSHIVPIPSTTSTTTTSAGISTNIHSTMDTSTVVFANVWNMWTDYIEFLNCVRSIFQPLDRMFVYIPPPSATTTTTPVTVNADNTKNQETMQKKLKKVDGEEEEKGKITLRNAMASAMTTGSNTTANSSSTNNSIAQQYGDFRSAAANAWDLWQIGMHLLWKHVSKTPTMDTISSSDAAMDDVIMSSPSSKSTVLSSIPSPRYSVLHALKTHIISSLITELDLNSTLNNSNSNSSTMDKTFIRNCISIFRSLNCTQDLLQDLITSLNVYFTNESNRWLLYQDPQQQYPHNGTTMTTSYNAKAFLKNVDQRLKQVHTMTFYYLLSSSSTKQTSSSLKFNPSSSAAAAAARYRHHNRLLTQIVENKLLKPHFTPTHILAPTNLFPILDLQQDNQPYYNNNTTSSSSVLSSHSSDGTNLNFSLLLYQFSKRIHPTVSVHHPHHASSTSSSSPSIPTGTELLCQAFASYGRHRGVSIVQMKNTSWLSAGDPSIQSTPPSITDGGGGGATKPSPPPLSFKEMQSLIIPNLLQFKNHVEYLVKVCFVNDALFLKSKKNFLDDILNYSGGIGDEDDDQNETVTNDHLVSQSGNTTMTTTHRRKKKKNEDDGKNVAELLAKYIDTRFKNSKTPSSMMMILDSTSANVATNVSGTSTVSNNFTTDDEMELIQKSVLELFQHIQSKDVFEAFYRRDLAKRLLSNKSASIDVERAFVAKLKGECGGGYTSKMEGMFKDMEVSRDVMNNYSAYLKGNSSESTAMDTESLSTKVEMEVQVLTTGYWPAYPVYESLILPPSLKQQKNLFENYYGSKYQGRRIVWQNSLGNCIVKADFPNIKGGPRELAVNLIQALVLLCFNDIVNVDDGLTILDVMQMTGLDDRGEAERVLQSLSLGRDGTRVLSKIDIPEADEDPNNTSFSKVDEEEEGTPRKKAKKIRKNVSDQDKFISNRYFTSNRHRITITNIQMKETQEERSKTHESVNRDRFFQIDAAVVRIMKARKTIDHQGLVGEVMKQLIRFPASAAEIKKRIESLLEREYMARMDDDHSKYVYLA